LGDENDRQSKAVNPSLIEDPDRKARQEAENAVRQFDRVLDMIEDVARGGRPFRLRVSMILDLHRIALEGLDAYAGNFRPGPVEIGLSQHVPPEAHLVPALVEDMCDYVMDNQEKASALHLCAYVMWRLNWIHPFTDGNGRTSRAVAYYVLCGKTGYQLPGRYSVPEQITADKQPYYKALEAADARYREGEIDLTALEELLEECLATQLLQAMDDAKHSGGTETVDRRLH